MLAVLMEQKLKQVELAKAAGVTRALVTQWMSGERQSMGFDAATRLHTKYGYAVAWLVRGEGPKLAQNFVSRSEDDLPSKEQILLQLYRGLFSHQQLELIGELRALFHANQIVRKELGQKPLRGVSNEAVEKAFGKVPPPWPAKARKAARPRPATPEEDPE